MTSSNQPPTPSRMARKPRGLLRFGLRLPILFYRLHLGWLLGKRFLLLTHTGRKSGLPRRTVIEVVRRDPHSGACVVASGWGRKSDWFQNISHNPLVTITLGAKQFAARALLLSAGQGAQELLDYARRYPLAFRELSAFMTGRPLEASPQACQELANTIPLVVFEPLPEPQTGGDNG